MFNNGCFGFTLPLYLRGGKPEWTQEAVDYLKQKGIELVIDRELNVNGLRLFGSPWTEKYAPWRTAFNVEHREMANTW